MIVVSVTYPATEGTHFDHDYYRQSHAALVQARWSPLGLTATRYIRGVSAPGGGPVAYYMTALLTFESEATFARAGQEHGKEVMGDIKNFTDVKPLVQFNEETH